MLRNENVNSSQFWIYPVDYLEYFSGTVNNYYYSDF